MDILERLYDAADRHLALEQANWGAFCADFRAACKADVAIYTPLFTPDERSCSGLDVKGTSSPEVIDRYLSEGIYGYHLISEVDLPPLTAVRRTDHITDDALRQLGPLSDFLLANGLFYFANVPVRLSDSRFLCLHVWRGEDECDFAQSELTRFALLMRYLLRVVNADPPRTQATTETLLVFASRHGLTETEAAILAELVAGASLRQIADGSDRSYGTIRWHVQNILAKCGVPSQRSLLTEFYRHMP